MTREILTMDEALSRFRSLLHQEQRTIVGVFGKPGAGKSTFTSLLVEAVNRTEAAIVSMDGFHLSNEVLTDLGLRERKGAPETFDAPGFAALLRRIRNQQLAPIFYPVFHREIEDSIAAEGVVHRDQRVVLVEGNYLALREGGWSELDGLFDELWYLQVDEDLRLQRLIDRHVRYGKTEAAAREWALGSDQSNAELIEASAHRADFFVRLG